MFAFDRSFWHEKYDKYDLSSHTSMAIRRALLISLFSWGWRNFPMSGRTWPDLGDDLTKSSTGRAVGAARGRDTNPVPCSRFIALAGGSARRNRHGDMTKVTNASRNGGSWFSSLDWYSTPCYRDLSLAIGRGLVVSGEPRLAPKITARTWGTRLGEVPL